MKQFLPYLKAFCGGVLLMSAAVTLATMPISQASDHNDGPMVLNTTEDHYGDIADVYVFREGDHNGNTGDNSNLVLVMTSNGLQPPGTSKPFSSKINYELKVTRGLDTTTQKVSTSLAKTLTFSFSEPATDGTQEITLNGTPAGKTTKFGATPVTNEVALSTHKLRVFAGPRDDPFFLDLQVVKDAKAFGADVPSDSFGKSNVAAIVVSVPIAYFQSEAKETLFGVWGTTTKK